MRTPSNNKYWITVVLSLPIVIGCYVVDPIIAVGAAYAAGLWTEWVRKHFKRLSGPDLIQAAADLGYTKWELAHIGSAENPRLGERFTAEKMYVRATGMPIGPSS